MGRVISNYSAGERHTKLALTLGVTVNLLILGYFKYTAFAIENISSIFDLSLEIPVITLPLAISFFTFQQIAYLVDAYYKDSMEDGILEYSLFVTFFPQLIAGPIVHHRQVLPQFQNLPPLTQWAENIAIGISIFGIGLFKKIVLADSLAIYANPVFSASEQGIDVSFIESWGGALAYTFQLYFDFSGYADMAIGLAKLFGINLPLNFYSPYKSLNIIEFWRRWHMTLSSFLRDYLYIPLGGNRYGEHRKYINLFLTMFLGGIWHGAGWTFVIWGSLHGFYLIINHLFQKLLPPVNPSLFRRLASGLLTFIAVVFAWVFFRATSFDSAWNMIAGMLMLHDVILPNQLSTFSSFLPIFMSYSSNFLGVFGSGIGVFLISISFPIVWLLPSTQEYIGRYSPAAIQKELIISPSPPYSWKPSFFSAALVSIAISSALIILLVGNDSEFLYFQF